MKSLKYLLFLLSFTSIAQLSGEVVMPEIAPSSPEAAEFTKHGNTQVNLYTGTPDISIPVYVIPGREFKLPITLNYDASGILVDQIATEVGLAWSLQAGGVITRITNGKPDHVLGANGYFGSYYTHYDMLNAFYHTSVQESETYQPENPSFFSTLEGYFTFEKNSVLTGEIDTQPDYYSLNVGPVSCEFYIDPVSGKAISTNGADYRIEYCGSLTDFTGGGIKSWHITDENGNQYFFNKYDVTNTYELSYNDYQKSFISSWQLTKIISANGKDIYDFTYSYADFWVNEKVMPFALSHISTPVPTSQSISCAGQSGNLNSTYPAYRIAQNYLTEIELNGRKVVTFERTTPRKDLSSRYTLDKILISNGLEWHLKHSYFKSSSGLDVNTANEDDIRLKLDGIAIKTTGSFKEEKTYAFEYYNENEVPNRQSHSQDYWGYYNGKPNSTMYGLIPRETILINGVPEVLEGADRNPNSATSKNGTIKKIYYPTGGHTEFEYELHKVNSYEQTIETENVEIGSLIGGNDPLDPYNYNDDEYFVDNPKGMEATVPVYVSGLKQLKINYSSPSAPYNPGDNDDGILFIALIKCPNGVPVSSECGGSPTLLPPCAAGMDWEEIVYNTGDERVLMKSYKGGPDVNALPNGYSETLSLDLEAGFYRLYILNGVTNSQLSVTMGYSSQTTQAVQKEVGGLRIKKTMDYNDNLGQPVTSKEYDYNDLVLNSCGNLFSSSTGKLHFNPNFSYYSYYTKRTTDGDGVCTYLERFSTALNPKKSPQVGYSLVTVSDVGQNGHNIGSTKSEFHNVIENTDPVNSPPYLKSDFRNGKPLKILFYDDLGVLLKKTENKYSQTKVENQIQGFKTSLGAYKEDAGLQVFTNGQYFEMIYPIPCYPNSVPLCYPSSADATVIYNNPFSQKLHRIYTISNHFPHLDESVVTEYFENDSMVTSQKYFYDGLLSPQKHRQVSRTLISTSHGTVENQTYYPDDITSNSFLEGDVLTSSEWNAIDSLKKTKNNGFPGRHRTGVAIQVKTQSFDLYGTLVSSITTRNNYREWESGLILPESIQNVKGEVSPSNPLRNSIIFHDYDSNGNLKEVSKKDGPHITYIWGYFNQFPIAKIENATYLDIAPLVSNLKTKSNEDTDRTIGLVGKEGILRTALANLSNTSSLADAHVTTYTYDPLIGLTSLTDPSGYTSYFDYDNQNRLAYIKEEDGSIIKEYLYNYAQRGLMATTTSSSSSVIVGQSVSLTTTTMGGSGDLSYKWTLMNSSLNQVYNTNVGFLSISTNSSHFPGFTVICEITDNDTGEVVSTSTLVNVLNSDPSFYVSPIFFSPSGNKSVGQNVSYSVNVSGGSGSYRYNWSKTSSSRTLLITDFDNSINDMVTLEDCTSFTVKCIVTDLNTNETVTKTVVMNVSSGCPIQP